MTSESPGPLGDPDFVVVGHLSKPHGTRGEVFVLPLTDHADNVFVSGSRVLFSTEGRRPDEGVDAFRMESVRPYRRGFLVVFDTVQDRRAAELLRGGYLLIPFEEVAPLADGELFHHQLLGMTVVTAGGEEVGTVREIYPLFPVDLLDVTGPGGDRLIPFTRAIVVEWSLDERRLVIDPPPGLLDI